LVGRRSHQQLEIKAIPIRVVLASNEDSIARNQAFFSQLSSTPGWLYMRAFRLLAMLLRSNPPLGAVRPSQSFFADGVYVNMVLGICSTYGPTVYDEQ
jgi:hypothetical protein